ncbi:MAG: hypothetical protein PUJ39_09590 [Eubacteriales bacterium]|nr:hypothetical protein [Eubacteriales bacterium]
MEIKTEITGKHIAFCKKNWLPKCGGKANGYADFSVVTGFDSALC